MSTLQENLDAIKLDKDTNLKPENLKKDVTCLGVTGTYEGSGGEGTVEGIKQFATVDEMQADTTAKEGDLAVVYRSEVQNTTVDSHFQTATFPDTVVLDTAITDSIEVRYRAVDENIMFDCMGQLDSSRFRMDCYTESGQIRIQYTSTDGITYTRTDTIGNPVDFGTEIYYEMAGMWNDAIGKFIQVSGNKFDGLYEYAKGVNSSKINFANINSLVFGGDNLGDYDATATEFTTLTITQDLINLIRNNISMSDWNWSQVTVWFQDENILRIAGYVVGAANCPMMAYFDENKNFLGISNSSHSTTATLNYADVNLTNMTVSTGTLSANENGVFECGLTLPNLCVISTGEFKASEVCDSSYFFTLNYTTGIKYSYNYIIYNYQLAHTQLSATPEYVYGKEFYGQNGVETGTLQNKENLTIDEVKHRVDIWSNYNSGIVCPSDAFGMFSDCTNLTTIPQLDTSNVTTMQGMFAACTNLTEIPLLDTSNATNMSTMFDNCTSLTTIPQLDTSSATTMASMFAACTNLTEIPLLDTSNVTNMFNMFAACPNLTTIPLLDTSNVTNMEGMFKNCTNLTTIPLLDTSKVLSMKSMFNSCTSLTDESLNNILAMCANATSYTYTKTLAYISLTSEQATKCTTLSNYSAFTAAGWTTGY